jgi:serine protease Do
MQEGTARHRLNHRMLTAVCAALALALAAGAAQAQRAAALPPPLHKNGTQVKAAFREVVAKAVASTARVFSDDAEVSLAAVVEKDGLLLTKASELNEGKLVCRLSDGRGYEAHVVASNKDDDLALIKIDAPDLVPVQWGDAKHVKVGQWIVTVGPGEDPVSVGVVSVPRRKITRTGGVLGIVMKVGDAGITIDKVAKDSGADKAGLKEGDVILQVDGKAINDQIALRSLVTSHDPGETLKVHYRRGDEENDVEVELGSREQTFASLDDNLAKRIRLHGQVSERKDGFKVVIQHDSVLRPQDCGGPVVTLDGKVVGLNIARADRVATYTLPADEVQGILKSLLAEAKKNEQK